MSAPELPAPRRARPSARAARQKERAAPPAAPPYLTRAIPPYELLSEEGLGQVERHADQLLEEIATQHARNPARSVPIDNSFEQWSAEGGRDRLHGRCRTSSAETPAPPANSRKINLLPLRGLATRVFTLPCDRGYPDARTAGSCYLSLCRAGGSGRQAGCALGESHAE
jgi:Trimethylamine methyltransferase (MTTB)